MIEPLFALLLLWAPVPDTEAVDPGCDYVMAVADSLTVAAGFQRCDIAHLPGRCAEYWPGSRSVIVDPRTLRDECSYGREFVIAHETAHSIGYLDEDAADAWAEARIP